MQDMTEIETWKSVLDYKQQEQELIEEEYYL